MGFEFITKIGSDDEERGLIETKNRVHQAEHWYAVPLAAVPVFQEGWPAMPDYMDGRQYFLWWKNNFEVDTKKSPFDGPILHNPLPIRENIKYELAGEQSRRWGA